MVSSSAFELRGLRPTVLYMSSFGAIFLMLRYRAHHREVSVRQQAKRSVPLPAVPLAYLVLIETDLSLGHLETVFYGPAPARDPDQLVDGRLRRAIGQVVGVLGGIFDAPAHLDRAGARKTSRKAFLPWSPSRPMARNHASSDRCFATVLACRWCPSW